MSEHQYVLQQAEACAEQEERCIAERDIEQLLTVAEKREVLIRHIDVSLEDTKDTSLEKRLEGLYAMNARLRQEAGALHKVLQEELMKLRSENQRFGGYVDGGGLGAVSGRLMSRMG